MHAKQMSLTAASAFASAFLVVVAFVSLALTVNAAPLPQLNLDRTQTSVSGASSGGYMAVQLHIAFSSSFKKGVGVVAGGPFNCADNSVLNAIGRCLGNAPIPVDDLVATTQKWAREGLIDPPSALENSKVYLFSSPSDTVVKPATTIALQAFYQNFLPAANIIHKRDIASEHGFVTDNYGAACLIKASPFINNCGFDLAGAMLQHLYGPLTASKAGGQESGSRSSPLSVPIPGLIEFDQSPFVTSHGMGTSGWIYVPSSCAAGAQCRLHVALHGCKQNSTDVGQEFVRNAGYNRWAENNNIVVLYPQTGKGATNSCWDWWGYDSANYAKKSGPQMVAIMAMVGHVAGGSTALAKAPSADLTPAKR